MTADWAMERARACEKCDGRGWLGNARAGQFPYLVKLAVMGKFPKRTCDACGGTAIQSLIDSEGRNP